MSARKDHDPLFGRTLAVLVLKALESLPAPITNAAIVEHLIARHRPGGVPHAQKKRLLKRVASVTDSYFKEGLATREQLTDTMKITFHGYTLTPPTDART